MDFRSDNVTGASPEILRAIHDANVGTVGSYGDDPWTEQFQKRMQEIFETDCLVYPLATGTAANSLGLACATPPWGMIFAHEHSHIEEDECGAPALFTGGAKIRLLAGAHGKFTAQSLDDAIVASGVGVQHHTQAASVSISQVTEAGTVYSIEEIEAIASVARRHRLPLHMDGARFANALVALGAKPADMTWRAGVDILSFGATKNGAVMAEALVFFNKDLARDFLFRRKQAGHLISKMRFVSAQLCAYVADDLWLRNARHANAAARAIVEGVGNLPGVGLVHPADANEIFLALPNAAIDALERDQVKFYRWGAPGSGMIRLVTAFNTPMEWADAFAAKLRALALARA